MSAPCPPTGPPIGTYTPSIREYAGLHAYVAQCTVSSTATTVNQPYDVSATVQQQFQLAAIPIFQYAVFYNLEHGN